MRSIKISINSFNLLGAYFLVPTPEIPIFHFTPFPFISLPFCNFKVSYDNERLVLLLFEIGMLNIINHYIYSMLFPILLLLSILIACTFALYKFLLEGNWLVTNIDLTAPWCWCLYFPCRAAARAALPDSWKWLVNMGGKSSAWSFSIWILIFAFNCLDIVCISAYCCIALSGQGAFASTV